MLIVQLKLVILEQFLMVQIGGVLSEFIEGVTNVVFLHLINDYDVYGLRGSVGLLVHFNLGLYIILMDISSRL